MILWDSYQRMGGYATVTLRHTAPEYSNREGAQRKSITNKAAPVKPVASEIPPLAKYLKAKKRVFKPKHSNNRVKPLKTSLGCFVFDQMIRNLL